MYVRQCVYLAVRSETLSRDEITQRLGISPDNAVIPGRYPLWEIETGGPIWARFRPDEHHEASPYSEQTDLTSMIEALAERLRPHTSALRKLCTDGHSSAELRLVRWYYKYPREADLGYVLRENVIDWLAAARVRISVDEYDLSGPGGDEELAELLVPADPPR